MAKLILTCCVGLPGSGKSHWSSQQVGSVVVTKDDIRSRLEETGWVWSYENEKDVIKERDRLIVEALSSGKDVISADTNLASKHIEALRGIAKKCGATFIIKSFKDVPVTTCVERDAKREGKARVGAKVITDMAVKYGLLGALPDSPGAIGLAAQTYVPDVSKPTAFICDLDGTIALFNGRGPFEYSKCDTDNVNKPVLEVVEALIMSGYRPIFCSGREEWAREKTLVFLNRYGLGSYPLYMRPSADYRKDSVIKVELFNQFRADWNIRFVIDDRPSVLRTWRGLGLATFAVGDQKEF